MIYTWCAMFGWRMFVVKAMVSLFSVLIASAVYVSSLALFMSTLTFRATFFEYMYLQLSCLKQSCFARSCFVGMALACQVYLINLSSANALRNHTRRFPAGSCCPPSSFTTHPVAAEEHGLLEPSSTSDAWKVFCLGCSKDIAKRQAPEHLMKTHRCSNDMVKGFTST